MLVTPRTKHDPVMAEISAAMGWEMQTEIETGIFVGGLNGNHFIANKKEDYFAFSDPFSEEYLDPYGVCDSIEQVKEKYAKWFAHPELKFCAFFTKIAKSEQPDQGGWRWHKWGKYIGTKQPQYEYIYDEDDSIQEVYVYHIYQLLD